MRRIHTFFWGLLLTVTVCVALPGQLHAEDPYSALQSHEISDSDVGNSSIPVNASTAAATSTVQMERLIKELESLVSSFEKLIAQLEIQIEEAESATTSTTYSGDVDVSSRLNVRASPWGKIIGKLANGAKVRIIAKEGDWFKIVYGDGYAYVHSFYVIADNAAYESAKEVVRPEQTPSTTQETTPPSTKAAPPTAAPPSGSTASYKGYVVVRCRYSVEDFAKATVNKISQSAGSYSDLCLSFAYYHAFKLFDGAALSSMSARAASKYQYASKFKQIENDDMSVIVGHVYDYINNNKPVVIQVNGNKAGTSRHYVTVVGYRSGKSRGELTGKDLLIIDSYDGKLETMDTSSSRFMMTGHARGSDYGYQIYVLK